MTWQRKFSSIPQLLHWWFWLGWLISFQRKTSQVIVSIMEKQAAKLSIFRSEGIQLIFARKLAP